MQDNPAHDRKEDGKRPAWWTRIVRATRIAREREPIDGLRPPMISRSDEDRASVPHRVSDQAGRNERRPATGFSCADIEQFYDALLAVDGRYEALAAAYAGLRLQDDTARTFASAGFPRRLDLMNQCIGMAMEAFPPRISRAPDPFFIRLAVIGLQAFVLNVQGCLDNLAHAWVREKGLTGEGGAPLATSRVGFGPGNVAVLKSLSPEFAGYLKELGPWFAYLPGFRHALEHDAQLYVPGGAVSKETLREYGEMGERINDAENCGNHDESDRLTYERNALVSFFPVVEHAFGENAEKGVFHFQMVSDFHTVAEIAERLLREFD